VKDKESAIIMGVLGVGALLAYAVSKGAGAKYGVAFAQVDPNSVAAVENAAVAQRQAQNQQTTDLAKIASDTFLGLVGANASLQNAQLSAAEAIDQAQIASNTSIQTATINEQGQTAQAQLAADATTQAASVLASMNEAIAATNADAQKTIAANQTTQAQSNAKASIQGSFWNSLTSIASAAMKFF
jgi:hypothetical protein